MTLPKPVREFLRSHTTMTLCTVGKEGTPAGAPLFYAVLDDGALIFVSEETTEHVQNVLSRPRVALTIYQDGQRWTEIRGMQARGRAAPLPRERWEEAWETYSTRFPFLQLSGQGEGEAVSLAQALTRARWYVVHLDWIRLIDNTRGFGWKAEWQREGEEWKRVR